MDYNAKLNMKQINKIADEYNIMKKIGSGAYGTVHTATLKHGDNEKVYAVKVIDKKKVVGKSKYALSFMTKEIETL